MFKLINNLSTGTLTTGTQMGSFLVTEKDTYCRMGNFMVGSSGETMVKTGSHWTNTSTGNTLNIGTGLDDDDY